MYNTSIQISFNRKNGCFFYIFTQSITNQIISIMCTCDNSLYLWHLDKKNCETLTGKIGKKTSFMVFIFQSKHSTSQCIGYIQTIKADVIKKH